MVLLILGNSAEAKVFDPQAPVDARTEPPVIITKPGPEFQDDARPGAMIIGMDRTPKGRIWGCWTGTGDKADGYFILATSDDGGAKWSKARLVVGALDPTGKRQRGALVGNLWTDPLGRLWLFFDQAVVGVHGPRADWFIRCDNPDSDAPVWSKAVCFSDEGCTLNKPTILKNGDWLLPVSKWADKTAWVFASTDQGKSWKPRGSVKFPDWNFDEHMMVELRDGRLWMLARTNGNPYESFSADYGKTWSEPKPAASVKNVNARFFLRRLASGRILLVKNGPPTERIEKRSHMSAYLSDDEGKTWKGGLLLDERSSVSYPDGFQAPDGLIHILYDLNRHSDAEILLAKFREEDVLAGKIVSKDAKLLMLANKATGPKPILYNGIELPYEWPPRHLDPASTDPMPVRYRMPKTIPIDVGRQLFVDDFLIEKTDMKRTFHQAQKHQANPVFKAETKNELGESSTGERGQEATCYLGHGGVFFDPRDGVFKMFYTAGWRGGLALATSRDLLHWTRGDVLLPPGKDAGHDNCVWLDINTKRPEERIKFMTCWGGHLLKTSADGREWSQPVPTGAAGDYCSFFFNPFRNVWVFSIKQGFPQRGRCRYYSESADFLKGADWSKAVYWGNADRLDKPEPEGRYPGAGEPTQLYSLNAVAYESVLLGQFYIHRGPNNRLCDEGKFPKLTDLCLGFSRDGFHWHRPDRRAFIAGTRKEGDWDRAYVHGTAGVCLVMDDKLWFPYTAFSGIAPSGKRGMYTGGSIGMATLRRDGFASMDAGDKPATLTTRPIKFSGEHLFVNLDAPRGELRVEVLTLENKNYGPFTAEKCIPLRGDSTRQRVIWRGVESLARASNKNVKLRFTLTNGSLYSFWITDDKNGASHGYVGAGGPGFKSTLDAGGK
ncbi:MAG: exo-alpha-sialidase [Verrucomicrobia bacterium]|nr:exo-alpha-sialidase [Verrucomicrobiota bacterium]